MIFGKDKEKFRRMENELTVLKRDINGVERERDSYRAKANLFEELRPKYESLTKKLRDQNDADLMLVSMKIIEEIKNGKKSSEIDDLLKEQAMYQRQRAALTNASLQQQGLGRGVGSGAIGNIFG